MATQKLTDQSTRAQTPSNARLRRNDAPADRLHFVQRLQQSVGNRATAVYLQRDTPNSTPMPDPAPAPPDETRSPPSFRVRIVAHASPRWRGASTPKAADANNLRLSLERSYAVQDAVRRMLAAHYPQGVNVTFEDAPPQPNTIGVGGEAHGSKDTLAEAKGDRSDDASTRRRVDVLVSTERTVSGDAPVSQPMRYRSTDSQFWYVNVKMTAGGSVGAAGALLVLELTNAASGESVEGHVFLGGGGPKAALGASTSPWSSPTSFMTDGKVNFEDFQNNWINYTTASVSLFIGYERAYLSFTGLGSDAKLINVSGATVGTAGLGAATLTGSLSLNKPLPPRRVPIDHSDTSSYPYQRSERGEDRYTILFETQHADLPEHEIAILESFIASVVEAHR